MDRLLREVASCLLWFVGVFIALILFMILASYLIGLLVGPMSQ